MNKISITLLLISLVFGIMFVSGCKEKSVELTLSKSYNLPYNTPRVKGPLADNRIHPFPLKDVRLLDGPFKANQERDREYLHSLDSDRLLYNFRINAQLPSDAEPLGGWEKPDVELRGHTVGHYLSACAMMYAATGDEGLKEKADYIVDELSKVQEVLSAGGYLSAFPEEFIDRVELTEKVWAPYYTLHKIFAGLLDMYIYCDNQTALDIAEKMAQWIKSRTDKLSYEDMQRMLNHTEQGGMNETLCNLYALTGEREYYQLARRFDQDSYTEPLSEYRNELQGLHVNSFIPNIIGTAREYELSGDQELRNIAEFFWQQVVHAHCFVTGGTSWHERWHSDPYHISQELGTNTQESCCTYNLLKLTRHLFLWNPDIKYADYYERSLFNGILPTQHPENGMMMYHVAMASGYYKTFMTPLNSFWCCSGTGMENHAKYGNSIYFYNQDELYVNLYIASELNWRDKNIIFKQKTRFPEENNSSFIIETEDPVDITINYRIPSWVKSRAKLSVNGKEQAISARGGSYMSISRTWKDGDQIDLVLPMSLYVERTPDDPSIAAIMYGPLVLAGELKKIELAHDEIYNKYAPKQDPIPVPDFKADPKHPDQWIKPVEGRILAFQTKGVGSPRDVILIPFYRLFDQRYAIYWKFQQ
ncbi:MAG: glycoside hydrolase family 127 protein [bacterium]